jgi:hypothetical protein
MNWWDWIVLAVVVFALVWPEVRHWWGRLRQWLLAQLLVFRYYRWRMCYRRTGHICFIPRHEGRGKDRRRVYRCLCGMVRCRNVNLSRGFRGDSALP